MSAERPSFPRRLGFWLSPIASMFAIAACSIDGSSSNSGDDEGTAPTAHIATSVGELHAGNYSLGPVAFSGSFWNSCAPYTPEIQKGIGDMLAGLALAFNGDGSLCDTCILMKTAKGKSVTARVITTGETHGVNDVDLSPAAFNAINEGEYPRAMSWQLIKCPAASGGENGNLQYQFQTEANPDWTSLWVRNARLPIRSVEVKSTHHESFAVLKRGTDGTLTDEAGFGDGAFTLRVTAEDGQVITDTLAKITPGGVSTSSGQFQ